MGGTTTPEKNGNQKKKIDDPYLTGQDQSKASNAFSWRLSLDRQMIRDSRSTLRLTTGCGRYVYRQVIGQTDHEITDLEEKKVIGDLQYDWAGPMPDHFAKKIAEG